MDTLVMILVVLFLAFLVFYQARQEDTFESFFNIENTNAMRGLWCLVVVLTHIPVEHGNKIQDLISSFGFIGVTFFFMTSAYGLTLSMNKKPEKIKVFWRSRLPKLLITSWTVNILSAIIGVIIGIPQRGIHSFFGIGNWVKWLIICYFFFWLAHIIIRKNAFLVNLVTCIFVCIFSVTVFYIVSVGLYKGTTWTTECYGFIWGVLLAVFGSAFYKYFKDKWFVKLGISCVVALVVGVCYLRFKYVPVAGNYLLKIFLGICITVFILISNVKITYSNKVNQFLGMVSFEVYLLHGKVFGIVEQLSNGKLSSSIFIVVSLITTIALAYVAHLVSNFVVKYVNKALLK